MRARPLPQAWRTCAYHPPRLRICRYKIEFSDDQDKPRVQLKYPQGMTGPQPQPYVPPPASAIPVQQAPPLPAMGGGAPPYSGQPMGAPPEMSSAPPIPPMGGGGASAVRPPPRRAGAVAFRHLPRCFQSPLISQMFTSNGSSVPFFIGKLRHHGIMHQA